VSYYETQHRVVDVDSGVSLRVRYAGGDEDAVEVVVERDGDAVSDARGRLVARVSREVWREMVAALEVELRGESEEGE
jgi:hypothetical protein